MFAIIRHAGYHLGSGALTPEGASDVLTLAKKLLATGTQWCEIRTSPTTRTRETAFILGQEMSVPVEVDDRLSTDGNITDILPPTEPRNIAFISHLPVITHMLRAWSRAFGMEEPPLTEVACGYLIQPDIKIITPLMPDEEVLAPGA